MANDPPCIHDLECSFILNIEQEHYGIIII
jgi:hypothetical protein